MNKTLDKDQNIAYNDNVSEGYAAVSDEDLCKAAHSGDSEAEEALVARYIRTVRIAARPYFLAGGDHEDIVQEGMIGLISAIRRFDSGKEACFSAFASRCIRNRLLEAVRAAARFKHSVLTDSIPLDALSLPCEPIDPENLFLSRENQSELFARLGGLLSRLELQILGLYLDGLSYQEISVQIGREPKSVDNAIQRVRRKLSGQNLWRSQT